MTNGISTSTVGSAYTNTLSKNSNIKGSSNQESQRSVKGEMKKVDVIKEQITSGEYKVDIDKLAEKMAKELIS